MHTLDDTHQGFTGHGTSFSDYQLRTPFVLRWPGKPPGRITRHTSHNDLAPTLVTELFGCDNPPADYASGHSLFSDAQWAWLVTLSHNDFALVEPEQFTIVYPSATRCATAAIVSSSAPRSRASTCGRPCRR